MAKILKRNCLLGEDELDLIVDKVRNSDDQKSFSEVCKLCYKLESLNRSSLRLLVIGVPRRVLPRFPNLVTFETFHPIWDDDLEFLRQTCPKLEVVNLNTDGIIFNCCFDLSGVGLLTLAKCCPNLSKIMLHMRMNITDSVPILLMSLAPNLTHLDLGRCDNISDEALEAIASSSSISCLNLQKCKITEAGLGFLANGCISKTLKTLILDRGFNITDVGLNINDVAVSHLQKMHCLEHLKLSYCIAITDIGGVAISAIPTLKLLSLEGLCQVSDRTVVALAQNCPNLESLDLSYCGITGAGYSCVFGSSLLTNYCVALL